MIKEINCVEITDDEGTAIMLAGPPYYIIQAPDSSLHDPAEDHYCKFANHSCSPNAKLMIEKFNGEETYRFILVAITDIPPSTEITWNYGFTMAPGVTTSMPCLCEANNCLRELNRNIHK